MEIKINTNETYAKNVKQLGIGAAIAVVLTGLSYLVADWAGWAKLDAINWLEAFAVFTSYVCTWLCVHQTRWNYPIGIVTTFAYSILFWQFELYAVSIFNAYLVFSLAYGYWRWGSDEDTRPVTLVNAWGYVGYIALAFVIYGLLWIINTIFGHEMGAVDIAIAIGSGVAQFLLDNKKLETWIVWIVVDIVSIWLYFQTGLFVVAFQYVFFLLNAFYGFFEWKKHLEPTYDGPDNFEEAIKEEFLSNSETKIQQQAAFA